VYRKPLENEGGKPLSFNGAIKETGNPAVAVDLRAFLGGIWHTGFAGGEELDGELEIAAPKAHANPRRQSYAQAPRRASASKRFMRQLNISGY